MTDTIVLGAGMVGVGTALALQARGRKVLLVDRRAPGQETSYGNAGILQGEAVEPYRLPRKIPELLSYAFGKHNQVDWRLAEAPVWAAPLWDYWRQSEAARHLLISRSYARLIQSALTDHRPLIKAAGADTLVRRSGFRQVYRSAAGFAAAARDAERLQRDYDVGSRIEDGASLAKAEPHLRIALAGSIHWQDAWSVADPGGLVTAYSQLFEAGGGQIALGDALSLRRPATGSGWEITTESGTFGATDVVVALGPWTPELLRPLGLRIPMVWKRGYHLHFKGAGPELPLMDAENSTVIAPMRAGVRVLTAAHITGVGKPPRSGQMARSVRAAADLFPLGEQVEPTPWSGNRPCLSRMLPVVGAAQGQPGLWLNFGHGHQGFTLGPTTGRLLAALIDGRTEDAALMAALAWRNT